MLDPSQRPLLDKKNWQRLLIRLLCGENCWIKSLARWNQLKSSWELEKKAHKQTVGYHTTDWINQRSLHTSSALEITAENTSLKLELIAPVTGRICQFSECHPLKMLHNDRPSACKPLGLQQSATCYNPLSNSLCAEKAPVHLYCTLLHNYNIWHVYALSPSVHKTRDQRESVATLYVHLAKDAHIGTESRLTARFRPLVGRFVRLSFRFQRLSGATLHFSRKIICGLLHPQLLPPTSYYQMTFNPSATRLFILHLLATVAMNVGGSYSLQISGTSKRCKNLHFIGRLQWQHI